MDDEMFYMFEEFRMLTLCYDANNKMKNSLFHVWFGVVCRLPFAIMRCNVHLHCDNTILGTRLWLCRPISYLFSIHSINSFPFSIQLFHSLCLHTIYLSLCLDFLTAVICVLFYINAMHDAISRSLRSYSILYFNWHPKYLYEKKKRNRTEQKALPVDQNTEKRRKTSQHNVRARYLLTYKKRWIKDKMHFECYRCVDV